MNRFLAWRAGKTITLFDVASRQVTKLAESIPGPLNVYKFGLCYEGVAFGGVGDVYVNPLPHSGRPFWPYISLIAKYSESAEGTVLLKMSYS